MGYYYIIQIGEVKENFKRMDKDKIVGLNDIPIKVQKCIGEQGFI